MNDNINSNAHAMIDTSSLLRCYTLLALSLPVTFLPIGLMSGIAMAVLIGSTIWAYRFKRRDDELFSNHGRWMLRTVGISSLFLFVAMLAAGMIVSSNSDRTALEQLIALQTSGEGTPQQMVDLLTQYQNTNFNLMIGATVGCFIPAFAYSLARFAKGYRLADAGKAVNNIKTWKF